MQRFCNDFAYISTEFILIRHNNRPVGIIYKISSFLKPTMIKWSSEKSLLFLDQYQ